MHAYISTYAAHDVSALEASAEARGSALRFQPLSLYEYYITLSHTYFAGPALQTLSFPRILHSPPQTSYSRLFCGLFVHGFLGFVRGTTGRIFCT